MTPPKPPRVPDAAALPVLLVAAPMPYHPHCGNGGGVLCFELLRRLDGRAEVHLVAFASPPGQDDGPALAALRAVARSVRLVPLPPARWRGAASVLLQLASGLPREVRNLRSGAMRAALAEAAAQARPDAVLLQFPHMAQYAEAVAGVPVIVDVQDAATVSRFREWRAGQAAGLGLLRRALKLHHWWTWTRHELRAYGRAKRLMALSETDLGVLRAFVPQVPAFLSPAAWDTVAAPPAGGAARVLFIGNFAHAPNADGLRWLLDDIWPRVRARCPDAVLLLAGAQLPPGLEDAAAGVQALGFVPALRPLFASVTLAVVPYRFGGGVKIKALEAMAEGCPVVATPVGCEGLGAHDGVHLRVAADAAAFADAVVELLGAPALRQALARAALGLVAERFSWPRKVDALLLEVDALVREQARQRAEPAA